MAEKTEAELKLEALRAERSAFDAERTAKLAETPEQALARETREYADAQALAKAQDEFGPENVALVKTPYGGVVVKKPKKILYTYFCEQQSLKEGVQLKLIYPCRVYPPAPAFDAIIEAYPDALYACTNAITKLAGARKIEDLEK